MPALKRQICDDDKILAYRRTVGAPLVSRGDTQKTPITSFSRVCSQNLLSDTHLKVNDVCARCDLACLRALTCMDMLRIKMAITTEDKTTIHIVPCGGGAMMVGVRGTPIERERERDWVGVLSRQSSSCISVLEMMYVA